ncbi:MAG: Transcriptional regulatory protein ZraR [Candidatus Hydrogenedentes bacterium ADurb.Bin101]|nr:MAG: Transcriptional regulatory protein ZraR [Candidatus Hydrogenedentes bacterium ADurb.Bin101]HOC70217.1 sigma-54 dependent transcriptional regulator [Candidatus Hydrogenedentota bacterium]HOH29444.1 sigma-54 dependent transcriptional regulator [Candidatus Hydrogenedentota bacterium]
MNGSPVILVADDEAAQRLLLEDALTHAGFSVKTCSNGKDAVEEATRCDLMLLDVRMPGMSGLEALEQLHRSHPELPVILLTAYIDVRDAVEAMKMGARDYLEKPVDLDELITVVEDTLGVHAEAQEGCMLPPEIIAESAPMRTVFQQAYKVAQTSATVLLLGESGVGKEVVAQFIHKTSERAGRPLVMVDCSALPENLVEAELFGHEKGAFTGADVAREGRFLQADTGTIFLDEIGEMPLALQPKLLRALETGTFRAVGGSRDVRVDVRVLAATNRDIEKEVEAGRFREDLYYRLNVFPLVIPPLREHPEDIPALAARMLKSQRKTTAPATERLLMAYDWPGNIRELRNVLERAAILSEGSRILPEALPPMLRKATPTPRARGSVLIGDMAAIERQAIQEALKKTSGNKTKAAQLLGISRRSLIYKLHAYSEEASENE